MEKKFKDPTKSEVICVIGQWLKFEKSIKENGDLVSEFWLSLTLVFRNYFSLLVRLDTMLASLKRYY